MTIEEQTDYPALVDRWVREMEVDARGGDRFVGAESHEERRLFGGLVLAQAAIAAGRTVDGRHLHSLHAYFLRPGRPRVPVEYHVERPRDGRTFTSRRVLAVQAGEAICDVTASFVREEEGIAHQEPMPDVAPPDMLRDARELYWANEDGSPSEPWPFEVRFVTPPDIPAKDDETKLALEWVRVRAPLPDDPVIHAAALIWQSDAGSFAGIERRYGWAGFSGHASASLDHAIWLHRPFAWDDWLLVVTDTPVASAARALTLRRFYARDGTHVATMAQEAVVRQERACR